MSTVRSFVLSAVLLCAAALGLTHCAADVDSPTPATFATVDGALTGGCHTVCPKCKPGAVCKLMPCYLECNGKAEQCVQTALCAQGYAWSPAKCGCIPSKGGKCTSDADCYLAADYCTSCTCLALETTQSVPTCSGPGVRCFADPCLDHAAVCDANTGKCLLQ